MPAIKRAFLAAVIAATPFAAYAHTGHGEVSGFLAGFGHPLTGLDHLAAMVAVGLLAGLAGGRALWLLPLAFVASMLAGAGAALGGVMLPGVEMLILGSVLALGLAVVLGFKLPAGALAAAVAFFGLFHGAAHGLKAAGSSTIALYLTGMVVATAGLHAAGTIVANAIPRVATQAMGVVVALIGAGLVLAA
ncbi:MAG TPA: HupE/UreJ family protein [Devosia sp.]|nr:HupE/UreJ family protein [Devosia sp.]